MNTPFMDIVWHCVDRELTRRNKKWAWLAREIGATDQVVNNWSRRGVPARQYAAIALALDWPIEVLFGAMPPGSVGAHTLPKTPKAHSVSHPQQIVTLRTLTKDEWMSVPAALLDNFQITITEDALGEPYEVGGTMRFSCSRAPAPRKPVLIEDRHGNRFVRLYVVGRGSNWLATAATSGYETLESERDGLRVLAVSTGYSWPDPA